MGEELVGGQAKQTGLKGHQRFLTTHLFYQPPFLDPTSFGVARHLLGDHPLFLNPSSLVPATADGYSDGSLASSPQQQINDRA
jgi:hypothetical protein